MGRGVLGQGRPPGAADAGPGPAGHSDRGRLGHLALGGLREALANLDKDRTFLKAGGVFTDDLIETYISYKRENEIMPVQIRPHPYEFALYYDV